MDFLPNARLPVRRTEAVRPGKRLASLVFIGVVIAVGVGVCVAVNSIPSQYTQQTLRGGCTGASRTGMVPVPVQVAPPDELVRLRCGIAEVVAEKARPDHVGVTFSTKGSATDPMLSYEGIMAPGGQVMAVQQVGYTNLAHLSGNGTDRIPTEGQCRFTYRSGSIAFISCKATIVEYNWRTILDVTFDAGVWW